MVLSSTISFDRDSRELAEQYDVVGQRQFEHGKLLISDLNVRPGQRVLDIGCGTGLLGAHVASLIGPAGKVFGIDPLPLRIEIASQKSSKTFEPAVGNAEDLSAFDAESFDVVFLNSVVHWLPDQLGVFRQINRVLKPNGKVGFTSASKEHPHSLVHFLELALASCGFSGPDVTALTTPHRLSSEEVSALFRASGFRETQVTVRTLTDHFRDVDEVITFNRSSSFGNHLTVLSSKDQARVRDALARELEANRTPQGLELKRHLIFAVAEKEQTSCNGCSAGCPTPSHSEAQSYVDSSVASLAARPSVGDNATVMSSRATAVHEVIAARRSIRKFKTDPVEEDKLARILESTRLAPSARNFQPWHYVVVTDPKIRQRLQRAHDSEWFYGAPVIVCACGEPSRNPARPGARDYRDIDVSISLDHLILAATAEGLGTCWVGAFDPVVVREELGIPEGIEPILMTPLGYPDEAPTARERKSFEQVFHRNRWSHG